MASFNKVILVGNITRDPELKTTPGGTAVTELGLAVNDRYKDKTGKYVEEVAFVDITLWGRQAEVACEFLVKGASVLVEGRLKLDAWQGKEGERKSKLKVVGDNFQMLDRRERQEETAPRRPAPQSHSRLTAAMDAPCAADADIPF